MNDIRTSLMAPLALALSFGMATAGAQTTPATPAAATSASTAELSSGEVVRWDPRTQKVTLRHGPIKNLDMPGMTMVFKLEDAAAASLMQPGAKVRFRAEQVQGAYVVTRVETAP